jgi:carboxyl-terminal processing protease
MSEKEFYQVVISMLRHLNDNHVVLSPTNADLKFFTAGILGNYKRCNDFKLSLIKSKYLEEVKTNGETIVYGKLPGNIGYIHFKDFAGDTEDYKIAMDEILEYLKGTKGIAIDVRMNEGGFDSGIKYLAGRFASDKRLFAIARLKNGPAHNDFCDPIYVYVNPEEGIHYSNPVIVLTNRFTISAGETFTLAMKSLDNVTQIGDTTSGAFSDMVYRELPNGWIYTFSVGYWNDKNDRSWEGIGCVPDILIEDDSADIVNGYDKVLEKSIELLLGK